MMCHLVADHRVEFARSEFGPETFGDDDLRLLARDADGHELGGRDDHYLVVTPVMVLPKVRVHPRKLRIHPRAANRCQPAADSCNRDRGHRQRKFKSTERQPMDRRIAQTGDPEGIHPMQDRRGTPQGETEYHTDKPERD